MEREPDSELRREASLSARSTRRRQRACRVTVASGPSRDTSRAGSPLSGAATALRSESRGGAVSESRGGAVSESRAAQCPSHGAAQCPRTQVGGRRSIRSKTCRRDQPASELLRQAPTTAAGRRAGAECVRWPGGRRRRPPLEVLSLPVALSRTPSSAAAGRQTARVPDSKPRCREAGGR